MTDLKDYELKEMILKLRTSSDSRLVELTR